MLLFFLLSVLIIFSILFGSIIPVRACSQVKLLFVIDGTRNVDSTVYQRQISIVQNVLQQIPDGSSVYIYSIGQTILNIVNIEYLKQADNSWVTTLSTFPRHEARGDEMSAKAIYNLININFDKNRKRSKAEVMVLFTNHDINGLNTTLAAKIGKKKLIIIPIGSSKLSASTLALAADVNHVLNMTADTNEHTLARSLVNIICQDAKYQCDTDFFKLPNLGRCRDCSGRCSSLIQRNCVPGVRCACDVCRYYHPAPFPTVQMLVAEGNTTNNIVTKVEDKSGQTVITIVAVVAIVIIIFFLLYVAYKIYIKYDCIKQMIHNWRHKPHYAVPETQHDAENGETHASYTGGEGDGNEMHDEENDEENEDSGSGDDEPDAASRNDENNESDEHEVEGAICDRTNTNHLDLPAVVVLWEQNNNVLAMPMNGVDERRGMEMDNLQQ